MPKKVRVVSPELKEPDVGLRDKEDRSTIPQLACSHGMFALGRGRQ